ncbi:hypothetical protein FQA39_LY03895 [Lamprigera yunnana]|nr:hypothetical protein FQA39_LY03895 [Lamprigera yunnana]
MIDDELSAMDKAIEEAAKRIQDMLSASRAADSGIKLEKELFKTGGRSFQNKLSDHGAHILSLMANQMKPLQNRYDDEAMILGAQREHKLKMKLYKEQLDQLSGKRNCGCSH